MLCSDWWNLAPHDECEESGEDRCERGAGRGSRCSRPQEHRQEGGESFNIFMFSSFSQKTPHSDSPCRSCNTVHILLPVEEPGSLPDVG